MTQIKQFPRDKNVFIETAIPKQNNAEDPVFISN